MKSIFLVLIVVLLNHFSFAQPIKPEEVKKDMKRVADWQIEHFNDVYRTIRLIIHWTGLTEHCT